MRFICMRLENHFHINGFTLSLALKQRLEATGKWTIYRTRNKCYNLKLSYDDW